MTRLLRLALLGLLVACVGAADPLPRLPPTEPADAAKTFRVRDGFTLQAVAYEPQVMDPVAAAYDEDGKLYVVEMRDYPEPHRPGEPPLGRVRLLEDRNGDGFYETATVFAEHLPWPTGVACWDGGVYVTAAPDIWYLKDTTGDGKADVRKRVYTGFVVNNVQALVNGLQWGVDNRIYGVTAGNGGSIRPADRPDAKPVRVSGRDFRFDPPLIPPLPGGGLRGGVGGRFEAIAGTAQFGNNFDDWYNRFVCANRLVCGHVVLPADALARNRHLPAARMVHDCAAEGSSEVLPMFQVSQVEPWRELRTRRYNAERQTLPKSEMVSSGVFTSGTGITVYRGAAYPAEYRGQMFVGNVAGNLVHRRSLTPKGATFEAKRIDDQTEFVASTDNWFRPVNFVNAPDGTLHVLDMYREVVEHPWSIPEDIKNQLHMTSGNDRGRIWRLTPPGFKQPPPPRLGKATTAELVATLEDPNAWWRETAQRLLYQRQDKSAVEPLRKLTRGSKSPLARMHALWTLRGLGELKTEDILAALQSDAAGLRVHGLRLAEGHLAESALARQVCKLADDPDAQVRFHAALALGELHDPVSTASLLHIAVRDVADPLTCIAVLSSAADRSHQLFAAILHDRVPSADEREFLAQLAAVVGARNKPAEVSAVLAALSTADLPKPVRRDLLISFGDGLLRAGKTLSALDLPAGPRKLFDELVADAAKAPDQEWALRLLAHADFATARPAFEAVLDPRKPQTLQLVAVRVMRTATAAGVAPLLLSRWKTYTPLLRSEVITTLSARPAWAKALLDAIDVGTVSRSQIDSSRQAVLKNHRDPAVRDRAVRLFAVATPAARQAVIARYQKAVEKPGDTAKGLAIFRRECASCHLAGNVGQIVGPAMATVRDKSPAELLTAILDPNREVDPRYLNYVVNLADGRSTSGVIAGESPTAVTLRRAEGAIESVLRTQIDELKSTGLSLMPDEFEKRVTPAEMADLLAFLKQPR
ncbi:MAG TPA: PVC-type heme-binding CxxCH protein [Fimbriiglobus sp.]|nr:PVC-type heme-binding CxxCH protein [Fimbriiglobus sp.]